MVRFKNFAAWVYLKKKFVMSLSPFRMFNMLIREKLENIEYI